MKNKSVLFDLKVLASLLLCGWLLYLVPVIHASFYFDDRRTIVNNSAIASLDLPRIFNAFNTRFLPGLSFALDYKFFGLNPFAFRLTNLLLHVLNSFLVYLLVGQTLGLAAKPAGGIPSTVLDQSNRWKAFLGALLFLCHPIQTEPVNFITQRYALMAAFFYLAAICLYIKSKNNPLARAGSYLTAMAAMFCKEFTVTLPLMLALYEFYFFNDATQWRQRFKSLIPFFLIALIVPYLLLRTPGGVVGSADIAQKNASGIDITRAKGSIIRGEYFLTELNVTCTYLRLLFLPLSLNLDYDYPITKHLDARTVCSSLFLVCLLITAWRCYPSNRLISFSILWFFLSLSVESSVIPIGDVITEYRLYLASAGFVLFVVGLKHSRPLAVLLILVFLFLTIQRNNVWRDEFTLWNDTIQKSPHKARPYNNRGLEYFAQARYHEAFADFSRSIELNPRYEAPYNNRGVLYAMNGDVKDALSDFNKALEINPQYKDAYNNRARTLKSN